MDNKYIVFIDNCIFDWMKNNFSYENNPRILSLKNHCINGNIELVFVSITKNEILTHLKNSIDEDFRKIKKLKKEIKWVDKYLTKEIVDNNIEEKQNAFFQFL